MGIYLDPKEAHGEMKRCFPRDLAVVDEVLNSLYGPLRPLLPSIYGNVCPPHTYVGAVVPLLQFAFLESFEEFGVIEVVLFV